MKGQLNGARLTIYLKEELDYSELTDWHFLGITTEIACSECSTSRELQSILEAFSMEWTTMGNPHAMDGPRHSALFSCVHE